MKERPIILVTNDDGIIARGIQTLARLMTEFGDVVVVAPDSPQSAKGHSITINEPLRLKESLAFEGVEGIEAYECTGTPADCVKLAKHVVLRDRKPDLCVSGINHGSNASINIIYSGTMSAAMEASLEGINSIGFSLLDFSMAADFEPCKKYVRHIVSYVLENGMGSTKLFNVNIPKLPIDEIKGMMVCRQANGNWKENFVYKEDPWGRPYYWLTGEFVNFDKGTDTDIYALENGYVSIVPSKHDLTDHTALNDVKAIEELKMV